MKTAEQLLSEIQVLGNPGTARVLKNHGAKEPVWGAKIGDMKPLVKGIKDEPELARALFASGVYDAMYLAGLIVNGATLGEKTIREWADLGYGPGISDSTVPWVAAEHPQALEFALEWIESPREFVAVTGWATLSGIVATRPDTDLDPAVFGALVDRVEAQLHGSPNRVRYQMNAFLISTGVFFEALRPRVLEAANKIGKVTVILGSEDCKVPVAADYIAKTLARGPVKKRKTMKC